MWSETALDSTCVPCTQDIQGDHGGVSAEPFCYGGADLFRTYSVQTVKEDGFLGELYVPAEDKYPGKALICFSGSDGGIELAYALGEDLPYSSYGMEKFPLGDILKKSIKLRDVTMYDLYLPLVQNPNPDAVTQVEKTTGPILLISSKMDNMWPSEPASEQVMKRLKEKKFSYLYQHLSYDYGGHMFVPMEFGQTKMFKGDRGKNKEPGLKARLDSLDKTL